MIESGFAKINNIFGERKMTAFWNGIKTKQRKHINSVLKPDEFAKFYSGIMTKDDSSLNNLQKHNKDVVHARFRDFKGNAAHKSFSTDDIIYA